MSHDNFIERTLERLVRAMARGFESEEIAQANGLLQHLDPRVKILGFAALIVATVMSRRLFIIVAIFVFTVLLALLSRVPFRRLALGLWLPVFLFAGIIALPAIFITPGNVIYRLPVVNLAVAAQGLRSAVFLLARSETAASLALLLVLCTSWPGTLKGLTVLKVPEVLVVILGMTYRYIYLLLETSREMFESRRSRTVGFLPGRERRRMAVVSAGVLMDKTLQLSDDVYLAMQSRGFVGEINILPEFSMTFRDYLGLLILLGMSAIAIWLGR